MRIDKPQALDRHAQFLAQLRQEWNLPSGRRMILNSLSVFSIVGMA